jgi:lipid A 3-O-deacylase
MKSKLIILALLALPFSAQLARAGDYLSLNVGDYDIFRKNQKAAQFGAEYRFDEIEYSLRPIAGAFVTSRGSTYGYGGFDWDVALVPQQLYLVPNFAIGAYGQGNGKDLGGVLEFRSGIELDYQFQNMQQVGVALNHISNAGIYSRNPGEETVMATYSVPISTLSHWLGR